MFLVSLQLAGSVRIIMTAILSFRSGTPSACIVLKTKASVVPLEFNFRVRVSIWIGYNRGINNGESALVRGDTPSPCVRPFTTRVLLFFNCISVIDSRNELSLKWFFSFTIRFIDSNLADHSIIEIQLNFEELLVYKLCGNSESFGGVINAKVFLTSPKNTFAFITPKLSPLVCLFRFRG